MSIATVSVLRRILDDVRWRAAPAPPPVIARIQSPELRAGVRLWMFETGDVGVTPYASALHFWAHALAAYLEAGGADAYFDAVAGGGLCDAVGDGLAERALARVWGDDPDWGGPFYETYRMIDQPVFQSYVGESRTCYRAFFWEDREWVTSRFCESPGAEG